MRRRLEISLRQLRVMSWLLAGSRVIMLKREYILCGEDEVKSANEIIPDSQINSTSK